MAAARANARIRAKKAANGTGGGDDGWDGGGGGEGEPTPGGGDDGGEEGSDAGVEPDEGQLWDWFFGLFKFLLFVTIFTILMVYFRPSDAINAYTVMFKSVISAAPDDFNFISDVWDFLNGPVMSLLEPDYFSVMKGYWPEDLHQYIHGNRMLGSVRLRQIRTTDSDCPTLHQHFLAADSTLQKHCFPPYSPSLDEGKTSKYPHYKRARDDLTLNDMGTDCAAQGCPEADGNITHCCTSFSHFKYKTYKELGESSVYHWGMYNLYPGGGFVIDLKNATDGREKLEMLARHGWLDLKTRALFIDFAFYNPNIDLFIVCRILFEFLPSGMVKPQSTYRVVKVNSFSFSDPATMAENVLLCVMIALIVWLAFDEVSEIWSELKDFNWKIFPTLKSHLSDFWNVMDIGTLFVAGFLLYLLFYQFGVVEDMIQDPDSMDASTLQNMAFWSTQSTSIAGVQALMLWLKVFKFVAVTHKLEKLFEAITKSIPAALELLVVYMIIVVAFTVSGHVIFGNDVPIFADLIVSFWSSTRVAFFQDYDWDSLYASNRVLGPIWIVLFMMFTAIFLINFLIGIFCEVYAEVMGEEAPEGKTSILEAFSNKVSDMFSLKKMHAKIADIESRLQDMDADGDGLVSKVELAEFLTREGAYEIFDATEVTEVMQRFDKDGNGSLSPDEMVELRAALQQRKAQLAQQIEEEAKNDPERGGDRSRPGSMTGPHEMKMALKDVKEQVDHLADEVKRSVMIEKKMLLALESLTTKVDSLVGRDNDMKYMRNSIVQDWMK